MQLQHLAQLLAYLARMGVCVWGGGGVVESCRPPKSASVISGQMITTYGSKPAEKLK